MEAIVQNFFNPTIMKAYYPELLSGMWVTLKLALLVLSTGLALGLFLAFLRAFQIKVVNVLIRIFVDFCRSMPALALIIVVYFALPFAGLKLNGFMAAWLVLMCILASFAEEIFWAGLTTISKGQWEAARSTGLTMSKTLVHVILPQAVRITVPPITSRVIATTKNTSLASVVAVPEMLAQANIVLSESGNTTPLTMAAIGYLIILLPLVRAARWLESRYQWRY